jgi:hypothetical protein
LRTARINRQGLNILINDETVVELPEDQDMVYQLCRGARVQMQPKMMPNPSKYGDKVPGHSVALVNMSDEFAAISSAPAKLVRSALVSNFETFYLYHIRTHLKLGQGSYR